MSKVCQTLILLLVAFVLASRAQSNGQQTSQEDGSQTALPGLSQSMGEDNELDLFGQGFSNEDDDYDADEDYESYSSEEDDEDEEEITEEELSGLVEEHFYVRMDCTEMQQMIKEANGTDQVDPELKEDFTACKKYLSELQEQIQLVFSKLIDTDKQILQ